MIEVEVKVALNDEEKEEVLNKLRERCLSERYYEEEDIFFVSIHDPSLGIDKTLKLRRSNSEAKLIFKRKKADENVKKNLELEVRIRREDVGNLLQVLRHLGFKESLVVKKRRRSFYLDGCTINVDDVEGLGSFLEVEVLSNGEGEDKAFNKIVEVLSALRLSGKKLIYKSYAEMIVCHDM